MNKLVGRKVNLELTVEEVRSMIEILLRFQADHQDNIFVESLLDQLIEQFDDFTKINNNLQDD